MSDGTIRVALVDDQQLVRAGFRMVIDSQADLEVVARGRRRGAGRARPRPRGADRHRPGRRRAHGRPDAHDGRADRDRADHRARPPTTPRRPA